MGFLHKRAYVTGAGGVFISRATSFLSGIFSLWLLSHLLIAADFAAYAVAMSLVTLLGQISVLGMERLLILKIAGLDPRPNIFLGKALLFKTLIFVSLLAGLLSIFVILIVLHVKVGSLASISHWIINLMLIVPALSAGLVLGGWFQANHKLGVSGLMQGFIDSLRCGFFAISFLFNLGPTAVAASAVAAAWAPSIILLYIAKGKSEAAPKNFDLKDILKGIQFLGIRLSQIGSRQLDILYLGFMAGSTEIAQYVVASRLAAVVILGQDAISNTYATRIRHRLASGNVMTLDREYHAIRLLSFLFALLVSVVFLVLGSVLLNSFNNFGGSFSSLLILASGHLVTASVGDHGTHMAMTGNLRLASFIRLSSFAVFGISLVYLLPIYSGVGAALSFFIASAFQALFGGLAFHFRFPNFASINPIFFIASLLASAWLILCAFQEQFRVPCAISFFAFATLICVLNQKAMLNLLSDIHR